MSEDARLAALQPTGGGDNCWFCMQYYGMESPHYVTPGCESTEDNTENVTWHRKRALAGQQNKIDFPCIEKYGCCTHCCRCGPCKQRVSDFKNRTLSDAACEDFENDGGPDCDFEDCMEGGGEMELDSNYVPEYLNELEALHLHPCTADEYLEVIRGGIADMSCGIEHQEEGMSRCFSPRIEQRDQSNDRSKWKEVTRAWPSGESCYFKGRDDYCSVIVLDVECSDNYKETISFCNCCCADGREGEELRSQLESLMTKLRTDAVADKSQLDQLVANMVC
jgi:hypothetical protein